MDALVGLEEFIGGAVDDGFSNDGIAVIVVNNHDVFHPMCGHGGELSLLIGGDGACHCGDVFDSCIDAVGAFTIL